MSRLLDFATQVFAALVVLGAIGFVTIVAAIALFGPQLKYLFKQWPF